MRNINFLTLYADATGLRIMVLANRLASTTETERLLHDWVEQHLARFMRFTRKALAAERRVLLNNDPHQDADLGEELYNYQAIYRDFWCEEDGYDLLDYVPLEMVEFRALLGTIYRCLRIQLPAWGLVLPDEVSLHDVDPADIDTECSGDLFRLFED
ncbi:hypothetical protein Brsp07_04882 [Brucella sp. NBRC 14130]|jgi:hypothetical protein|uniref:hypothetical protein n=1 Tax=Hyphomicrobiales TaxID=356 RepID=UPI001F3D51A6|nr:hypothetical protein [Shinella sp. NM-101]